jgi:hypothetical protein
MHTFVRNFNKLTCSKKGKFATHYSCNFYKLTCWAGPLRMVWLWGRHSGSSAAEGRASWAVSWEARGCGPATLTVNNQHSINIIVWRQQRRQKIREKKCE